MTKELKNRILENKVLTYDERMEIIKSLEQSTSDDCVSIAELEKWLDLNFSFGGACRKLELFDRLEKELPRVTPTFPKGETNGDIIKAIFPNAKIDINEMLGVSGIVFVDSENEIIPISQDWWNAPYKRGNEE